MNFGKGNHRSELEHHWVWFSYEMRVSFVQYTQNQAKLSAFCSPTLEVFDD